MHLQMRAFREDPPTTIQAQIATTKQLGPLNDEGIPIKVRDKSKEIQSGGDRPQGQLRRARSTTTSCITKGLRTVSLSA